MVDAPKVYVTRRIPERGLALLCKHCAVEIWPGDLPVPSEVLLDAMRDAEGVLCMLTDRVDAALLDAAPRLRVVSNYAVGYNNIDVAACSARGILVGHTPGVLTETTADFAFALLMAAARRVVEGVDHIRNGRWQTWGPLTLLGRDVHGATLGIVGLGRIGMAMARRAQGFSMQVLFTDDRATPAPGIAATRVDLETLLRESDFISLHVPLTKATHHLIGMAELTKVKASAILINTARGPVVDALALYEALRDGRLAAAALDVTDPEPIAVDDPLLTLPNCLIVPHIASASVATREKMALLAVENLLAGLRGTDLPHCVNCEFV